MLMLPIASGSASKVNFQNVIIPKLNTINPNISKSELEGLIELPPVHWLEGISLGNNHYGNNLTEGEKILNKFVRQVFLSLKAITSNITQNNITLPAWRSLFEVTVLFRTLSQTVTVTKDEKLFTLLLQRFKDYGEISNYRGERNIPLNVLELQKQYRGLPKELCLEQEYDWFNPIFPPQQLKRMSKSFHPSFRDLVERTKETNHELAQLLEYYKLASNVLHFTFLTDSLSESITAEEILKLSKTVACEFLITYFDLMIEMYQKNQDEQTKIILSLTKQLRDEVYLKW